MGLNLIALDFSANCYSHVDKTLQTLIDHNYKGKLFVHIDQTKTSHTCGWPLPDPGDASAYGTSISTCLANLKQVIGDNIADVTGILWEQEGNKVMNGCSQGNACTKFYKKHNLEFAGWTTNFDFIGAAPDPSWDYVFYEYYNIYTKSCRKGGTTPPPDNSTCLVDYNPPGAKNFPGATCGPDLSCTGLSTNNVYCANLSPKQRGDWMAHVLIRQYGGTLSPILTPEKKFIFFTFTNGSSPSFLKTITTAAQFDTFVEAFINRIKEAGGDGIEECTIGVWGCPKWIAYSAPAYC